MPADRPVAIRRLEQRLIRKLNTTGGLGIFTVYLHRFLLWQRSGEVLARIPSEIWPYFIPSWSCLAYEGGVEYMAMPFGNVTWNPEIISPFEMP